MPRYLGKTAAIKKYLIWQKADSGRKNETLTAQAEQMKKRRWRGSFSV
jgi:hypothetical protein